MKRPCLCGAKNCSGQIGVKPKGEDGDDDADDASVATGTKGKKKGNGESVKVRVCAVMNAYNICVTGRSHSLYSATHDLPGYTI